MCCYYARYLALCHNLIYWRDQSTTFKTLNNNTNKTCYTTDIKEVYRWSHIQMFLGEEGPLIAQISFVLNNLSPHKNPYATREKFTYTTLDLRWHKNHLLCKGYQEGEARVTMDHSNDGGFHFRYILCKAYTSILFSGRRAQNTSRWN